MTTTKQNEVSVAYSQQFADEHWKEIATRAVANGRSENDFILSCHIANRPAALKAYRRAIKGQ